MTFRLTFAALAVAYLGACAHAEMTGDEHRAAAVQAEQKADAEKAEYDPNAKATRAAPRVPIEAAIDEMRTYNPTEGHLVEADRQMKIAFDHLMAAERLGKYEDEACAGVALAERTSCPVMAPYVAAVQEVASGVTLQLKATAPAGRLAGQMRCHLAFAKANDFVSVPCPLYVKGVSISLREGTKIDILSPDAKVAVEVRREARRMFGETVAQ